MGEFDAIDISSVVCPETGVTAREAAVSAVIARDHLGAEAVATPLAPTRTRRLAMIEDIRVLTGVLVLDLDTAAPPAGPYDAALRARLVHRATLRSDAFALCAALALDELDEDMRRGRRDG
ncbi:hypothetical protein GCM10023200_36420 [Actinomycetospora chlora]|uniref:Uncharacterized protein n=1 Tax=Actinomycetospora chlora TaxID=663608 RepID=A0ABP9BKV6_9PSEU